MQIKSFFAAVMAAICAFTAGCTGNGGESSGSNSVTEPAETVVSGPESTVIEDEIDKELNGLEFTAKIKVGWNLGNTLDATGGASVSSETSWGNPKTTEELILAVKEAGFNAVRVPTTWGPHMDENNAISEEWMSRVEEVVRYVYDNDMYVILNMHHESWNYPYEDNKEKAAEIMTAAWTQIGERFKGYDERLIFEGMNEPRWVGKPEEWNGGNDEGRSVVNYLDQVFVDTVRATGGNNEHRFLMVCPYGANSGEGALAALQIPNDPSERIIVSTHAYTPYSFALQKDGSDKWMADRPNSTRDIDTLAEVLDKLFISKGIPVIIGETGAMNKDNEEFRADWAEYFISTFKKLGVPCFIWDNGAFTSGETFGIFDRYTYEVKYPELVKAFMTGAEAV